MMIPTTTFKNPFELMVNRRFSCRTFSRLKIETDKLEKLTGFMASSSTIFPGFIRLEITNKQALKKENLFTTGAYGIIKGFDTFIAGIMRKKNSSIGLSYGALMERALMFATDLDLNSCWIGGVFDRKTLSKVLKIENRETIPAIIALGYASEKKTFRDQVSHWIARGGRRKPPEKLFFKESHPQPFDYTEYPEYQILLESVRRAPSASNLQPWRIFFQPLENHIFHFYLSRDKVYSKLVSRADLQKIDMGIAAFHFQQSARENGLKLKAIRKNPGLPGLPHYYEYMISFEIAK